MQAAVDQLAFETFEFQRLATLPAARAVLYSPAYRAAASTEQLDADQLAFIERTPTGAPIVEAGVGSGTGLVVDSGFSFTHAVPLYRYQTVLKAVKRYVRL